MDGLGNGIIHVRSCHNYGGILAGKNICISIE